MTSQPFAHSEGPLTAKIALVGEAWGEQEDKWGRPFQGHSGQELTDMLKESGIDRKDCFITNVFALRPENNKILTLFSKKADAGKGALLPPYAQGKYLLEQYIPEVERCKEEIRRVRPNVVVLLGGTAIWAFTGVGKVGSVRGVFSYSSEIPGQKILPTYHPAGVMRNWSWRPIVIADLMKAKAGSLSSTVTRPVRYVLIEPTLGEIYEWFRRPADAYSVDIETARARIQCIGFSRTPADAIVIPFYDGRKPGFSYWPTLRDEVIARSAVMAALAGPVPKLFQNGLYDMQYLWREGMPVRNTRDDTMILHHAMFPEMPKGLGFLGSIYSNEASWKLMNRHDTTKRDE